MIPSRTIIAVAWSAISLWLATSCTTPSGPTPITIDDERIALGRKLFFSTELSRTQTMSCASCHQPDHAFANNDATTHGVEGRSGTRNVPSLIDVALQPYFLREGSLPTLEMQVLVPIEEHNEFDFNILRIQARLEQDSSIVRAAKRAYDRTPDYFVITRAIAAYERTLVNAPLDLEQLSDAARRGRTLFASERTQCASCHGGQAFTSYAFENNGLYEVYADAGRQRFTGNATDIGRFKVPSLRNVVLTAPYMHNGSVPTLRAVLDHYNSGGRPHPNRSTHIRPLGLTSSELDDLEAFLRAL